MTPDEKQQLSKARDLIKAKQYDEARRILQGMPFNDTAQDWLLKLSQIKQTNTAASIPSSGQTATAASTANWNHLRPWNPKLGTTNRGFAAVSTILAIPLLFFYSFNWRHLGKPNWIVESILLGVLLLMGVILAAALTIADVLSIKIGFLLGANFYIGLSVYVDAIAELQDEPYKKWRDGNTQAMLEHPYDFQWAILYWVGITIVVGGIASYLILREEFPQ